MKVEDLKNSIKNYNNLDLEPCDFFTKRLSKSKQERIFEFLIKNPQWLSDEFDKLVSYGSIRGYKVELSGYNRVRITIK